MGLCKRNTEERWREFRSREGEDTEKKGKEGEKGGKYFQLEDIIFQHNLKSSPIDLDAAESH